MWQQVYATSRTGKRYVKAWTDGKQTISNRQYQQHYGSVAKAGFTTIERKEKFTKQAVRRLFKHAKTQQIEHGIDINGDWVAQIQLALDIHKDAHGMFLTVWGKDGKGKRGFQTHVWGRDDIDGMIEEMQGFIDEYGIDDIIGATITTIGETD